MLATISRGGNLQNLTNNIEHKAEEAVMCRKWEQNLVHQHNVLKVVNNTFSVKEVHGRCQPVPVQRLCEAQPPCPAGHIRNGNDLFERHHLHGSDNSNNVNVTHEHGAKEDANHDERPYGSGNEGSLLEFVLGGMYLLDLLSAQVSHVTR